MVRVPFLPTHSSVLLLRRPTCTWPGQSPVARVAEPLSAARVEPPSVARVAASLSVVHVEPPSVARVVEPLLLADATTEAFGMVPRGGFGAAVGGHTV